MDFEENQRKSLHIVQFKCKCSNSWWGSLKNNTCRKCKKSNATKLPLEQMIGIGWFHCKCGRKYAGFCKGSVSSKCHGCQTENFASFILPGDKAAKEEKTDKSHYCNACKGNGTCPIVNSIVHKRNDVSIHRRR